MKSIFEYIQTNRFMIVLSLLVLAIAVTFLPDYMLHTILQTLTTVGAVIVYLLTYGEEHWTFVMNKLGEPDPRPLEEYNDPEVTEGDHDDDASSEEARHLHAVGGKSDGDAESDGPGSKGRAVANSDSH
jgi:hypothetical protein